MKLFCKKSAFTLAEIMVTLGLLGCIAALTLPTLSYNYKGKVLEQQFRSTYSELREIGSSLNIEYGDVGEYAQKNYSNWDRVLMTHLGGTQISAANSDSNIDQAMKNIYKDGNGPQGPFVFDLKGHPKTTAMICNNDGIWLDRKGRIWTFNAENNIACVDINGMAPPNRINVDIFAFKPMSAKEMTVWNYNDNVNNANNYSGTIVPCDLDRLSSGASPNGTYANSDLCPGEGSKCCNGGTAYAYEKGSGTAVDACPFNEPVENIAPQKKNAKGEVTGNGTSSRGRVMTTSNNYWKDYIDYK